MQIIYVAFLKAPQTNIVSNFERENLHITFWVPSGLNFVPSGISLSWQSVMYRILFKNKYSACVIYGPSGEVLHHSFIFPRHFRFPFMRKNDLQIGNVWTTPRWRGFGLAKLAVQKIIESNPNVNLWYLTKQTNKASIRVAENNGFIEYGKCSKDTLAYHFV